MWRYGILYRACYFLESLVDNPRTEKDLLSSFPGTSFRGVPIKDVIEVSSYTSWIDEDEGGSLFATDKGKKLLATNSDMLRIRQQVGELIELMRPSWAALAVQGRKAMLNYLDENVLQCFKESGLIKGHAPDVVEWWDRLAANYRAPESFRKTEIGRKGEKLSCEYELSRTGEWPNWIALEQTEAGYDLVSQVSREDQRRLVIEVKTSTLDWEFAKFFMSRNEWDILYNHHPNAHVHLWWLKDEEQPKNSTLNLDQLKEHVPQDTGNGKWENFSCRFSEFNFLPN